MIDLTGRAKARLARLIHGKADYDMLARISAARQATFILAMAGTKLSDIDGVSAAGTNPESIRHTPARDARALMGALKDGESLPASPSGVTSPVVLTRAALSFINHRKFIVDCGSFHRADIGEEVLIKDPSASIETGLAQSDQTVRQLFEGGVARAKALAKEELVVIAECVPGGTTTALAVLLALGFPAQNLLSGSHIKPNNEAKLALAQRGLRAVAARLKLNLDELPSLFQSQPLLAVSSLGDGMQAYAAGLCRQRDSQGQLTVLAGGSQMLAVFALSQAIGQLEQSKTSTKSKLCHSLVATTKWVAADPHADTPALAAMIDAHYAASFLDLSKSRHAGLRAYEEGHVKEGVGAGAAMMLAHLMGQADEATLLEVIDSYYEALIS